MIQNIPNSWKKSLTEELQKPYITNLEEYIEEEYKNIECFPAKENIFRALEKTPLDRVKVVILWQDPYHTPGAAMGLSFSVPNGSKMQPSLRNMFQELTSDLGVPRTTTDLSDWAEQGVLMLNSVLTVRSGEPASHKKQGWEHFTDAVIRRISEERSGVVFILWGNYAIAKSSLIDDTKHTILTSAHPSPFSAYNGFFGSKPFSKTNEALQKNGVSPIVWG